MPNTNSKVKAQTLTIELGPRKTLAISSMIASETETGDDAELSEMLELSTIPLVKLLSFSNHTLVL